MVLVPQCHVWLWCMPLCHSIKQIFSHGKHINVTYVSLKCSHLTTVQQTKLIDDRSPRMSANSAQSYWTWFAVTHWVTCWPRCYVPPSRGEALFCQAASKPDFESKCCLTCILIGIQIDIIEASSPVVTHQHCWQIIVFGANDHQWHVHHRYQAVHNRSL